MASTRATRRRRANSSERFWGWAASAVLALAVVVGGAYYMQAKGSSEDTNAETANTSGNGADRSGSDKNQEGVVSVKVVHPDKGGLPRTTTQPGVLHYFESADLQAKASGYLRAQIVDIGDVVTRGQVLAEIYNPERQQDVEEATAELERARAEAVQAEAELEAAHAEVVAARAEVHQREAEVEQSTALRKYREKEYLRYQQLAERKVVDERVVDEQQKNYESAKSSEDVAVAAVETARGRLLKAEAQVDVSEAQLRVARAMVQVREAGQRRATLLAEYLKIVSPYDGVVTRRNFHRGAFIPEADKGQATTILSVARTDRIRVVLYVPDRDVPLVDPGDKAVIQLDALPGEQFEAQVSRLSNVEISANRTMRVEVDLPNPSGRLREGMYGLVTILLEKPTDYLTIPSSALVSTDGHGGGTVWVVREGHAYKETVRVGKDDGIRVEILEGLSTDDQVIATSVTIEDGEPVEPEPASVFVGSNEGGRGIVADGSRLKPG